MRTWIYQVIRGNPQTGIEVIIGEFILRSYASAFVDNIGELEPQYVFWIREVEV